MESLLLPPLMELVPVKMQSLHLHLKILFRAENRIHEELCCNGLLDDAVVLAFDLAVEVFGRGDLALYHFL